MCLPLFADTHTDMLAVDGAADAIPGGDTSSRGAADDADGKQFLLCVWVVWRFWYRLWCVPVLLMLRIARVGARMGLSCPLSTSCS